MDDLDVFIVQRTICLDCGEALVRYRADVWVHYDHDRWRDHPHDPVPGKPF